MTDEILEQELREQLIESGADEDTIEDFIDQMADSIDHL